jgi:tRNA/rRNA methyltransferase
MNLSNICIILSNPDESRNIGSVCRAMANMGIEKLRIVGKKENYDDEKVRVLAIHASYIWDNAEFFESITEAAKDCSICAGTTRRRGKKRKNFLIFPEEFTDICDKNAKARVAVVFGNERTGLTDTELEECTIGVTIPSDAAFGSLNLSHAVQIICYELFKKSRSNSGGYTPVSLSRLNQAIKTITESQKKVGFFKQTDSTDMENFWKTILSRASLSESEVKYLEKIFTKTAGLISKQDSH